MSTEASSKEQPAGGAPPTGGLTIVVLKDDKIAEILDRARDLLDVQLRHTLELGRAGLTAMLREGDGCCNCVAC
jgi:hypothetical protein